MVKEKLLGILEGDRGVSFSGQELAGKLGVSRNAVWKAVTALRREGYDIAASVSGGYRLAEGSDILSAQAISAALRGAPGVAEIILLERVDSTNSYLKSLASGGAAPGTVVVAREQQAGRGRLGRSFYSPARHGIYMSLLLRPALELDNLNYITVMAAVAVCESIIALTGAKVAVKWVNDILCGDKKLCGILTEASIEGESGHIDSVVLGIGVNVGQDLDRPEELRDIVTSLEEEGFACRKNELIGEILRRFMTLYKNYNNSGDASPIVAAYREHLWGVGRRIRAVQAQGSFEATLMGVNDKAELCVRGDGGAVSVLRTGEISIRPL